MLLLNMICFNSFAARLPLCQLFIVCESDQGCPVVVLRFIDEYCFTL